jgi:multimeric flavodoxin WrbA
MATILRITRGFEMKVIGILGSPRKNGNSETLVRAVLEGAKEKGHETEIFLLGEMSYQGCVACMYCKTHDRCKQEDDLTKVMDAIEETDAIVLGAPIYMMQYSGQFKLFEDRLYQFLGTGSRRTSEGFDFKISLKPGKKAIVITTQGNPDPKMFECATDGLTNLLKMYGFQLNDSILLTAGNSPSAARENKGLMERARQDGRAL